MRILYDSDEEYEKRRREEDILKYLTPQTRQSRSIPRTKSRMYLVETSPKRSQSRPMRLANDESDDYEYFAVPKSHIGDYYEDEDDTYYDDFDFFSPRSEGNWRSYSGSQNYNMVSKGC